MPDAIPHFFIGIDPASETFAAAIFHSPEEADLLTAQFANELNGLDLFLRWLSDHDVSADDCIVCVEATGVYAETLCYFLHERGFPVVVEGPHQVKRAFKTNSNKNDPTDARQIAEYAFRFFDELRLWQPKAALIEQIRVLLTTREQLVSHLSANNNLQKSLQRKVVETPAATEALTTMIAQLKEQIQAVEEEIKRLIRSDPTLSEMLTLLLSIPSVGLLLSAHLMVVTDGFRRKVTARQLAAYIGICPYEHTSGTSVKKPSRSRGYGPSVLRKLVYTGALNLKRCSPRYRAYYERKKAEGKNGRLVLNNLSNKLLRVICAVVRQGQPYRETYRSVHPIRLQTA